MIYQGPPLFYALIGLPRSGTSIIARTLHSVENGFCISEPLHRLGFEAMKKGESIDKIGPCKIRQYGEIVGAIYEKWLDPFSAWQIGGIKEVDVVNNSGGFTRWEQLFKTDIFLPIFVDRPPEMIYDAWKRSEFKTRGIDAFCKTYRYLQQIRPKLYHRVIHYEAFCADPIAELNRVFSPGLFSGKVSLNPITGVVGPMDIKAKGSAEILPAKVGHELEGWEVEFIKRECYEIKANQSPDPSGEA